MVKNHSKRAIFSDVLPYKAKIGKNKGIKLFDFVQNSLITNKMCKNRKITSQEFDYLAQMKPYVAKSSKKDVKYALLDSIERVFGDKWFNLSDKTRQAIDYICFLSIERGFCYASPEHIADKSGISKSTIYEALKLLRDNGVVYKANRCSRKQNGLGCPVHFFVNHPYFEHYNTRFAFEWKADGKADWKAESAEIPCGSKDEQIKTVPTLPLPSLDLKNRDKHTKVTQYSQSPIVKYVPKEINTMYAKLFGNRLRNIWVKITQSFKSINQCILNRNDLITIGSKIIQRILTISTDKDMSLDEMCAFAYKASRDAFYTMLGQIYMEDMPKPVRTLGKAYQNRTVPTSWKKAVNSTPHWMDKLQNAFVSPAMSQKSVEDLMERYKDDTFLTGLV